MKAFIKSLLRIDSMFSRLIASFVLIIIIISSVHLVTNQIYVNNMEQEISQNVSERLENIVQEYEQYFDNIKNNMLLDFYIEYADVLKAPKKHDYENALMLKSLNRYLLIYPYIKDFIVYIRDFDYAITINGTLETSSLFSRFYASHYYTEDFWLAEMEKNFMYKIYPLKKFVLNDSIKQPENQQLMPIVMKHISGTDFIIIVMVDMIQFSGSLDTDFVHDLAIYDETGALVYSGENSAPEGEAAPAIQDIPRESDLSEYQKVKDGYLFTYKSSQSALTYRKYYSDAIIRRQINETNSLLSVIILLAILISGLLSLFIVKKFSNPVKRMYQLIRGKNPVSGPGQDIVNLKNFNNLVSAIVSENTTYAKDLNEKNSLLKNYFWQTRLKNIILNPGESGLHLLEYTKFALIMFKLHYREAYYEYVCQGTNEEAYIIKDLINIYVCEKFCDSVTFQIDARQIVSIVEVGQEEDTIIGRVETIAQKLTSEDEFVYFTVAYSDVYRNSSELHAVFEKVSKMLRYRKLSDKTQTISERVFTGKLDRFYFARDQQEQFVSLLKSGRKEECLQLLDDVFEYNLKKETNELCIYLLYVKMMDCCYDALLQQYTKNNDKLPLANIYFNLEQSESTDDYRTRYRIAVSESIKYFNENLKESDYIVDTVKKYIEEHYAEDISVDLLADKLKISRTYLSRHFKEVMGMNLSDYLNMFCVRKACVLLENSMLMVKDIAPQVGINSISTFTRLFKSYTGMTPNDYRKKNIV